MKQLPLAEPVAVKMVRFGTNAKALDRSLNHALWPLILLALVLLLFYAAPTIGESQRDGSFGLLTILFVAAPFALIAWSLYGQAKTYNRAAAINAEYGSDMRALYLWSFEEHEADLRNLLVWNWSEQELTAAAAHLSTSKS